MFSLSLFRPSSQSNISMSGEERFKYPLPWEDKISQMPYPRTNKDNQIPTPCPALPPPPHYTIMFGIQLMPEKLGKVFQVLMLCLQKNWVTVCLRR